MKNLITRMLGVSLNTLAILAPHYAARKAFSVFCYPFRGKLQAYHMEFLNSAEKIEIPLRGEKVIAYKWGTGPVKLLFLHGWQSHTFRWKSYIEALGKDKYTVYGIDAPGHGLSTGRAMTVLLFAEAIRELYKLTGKADVVIGHSIGSFTALFTFHQYRELAPRKLVLLAPPGEVTDFLSLFRKRLKLSARITELLTAYFTQVVGRPPSYFSSRRFAEGLDFPGLIIHDEGDEDSPVGYAEEIHRQWKKSRLLITNGLGHNLKSETVINEVTSFIQNNVEVRSDVE